MPYQQLKQTLLGKDLVFPIAEQAAAYHPTALKPE
jgi:hypothetical protein